ncbi:all-trans-retinol 13,14-reductase [Paroedura picta]|uniref:all-trans-retinol 13,14-reductase n=1 Tax=Paroedura picta TaxID=143630 RepID=UPI004057435D
MWVYLAALGALLLALYKVLGGRRRSANPFPADCTRPPAPLVTDKDARSRVLKRAFSQDRVPDRLDAIVIGSGYGGLAAAVVLSKAGQRVLVLEKHGKAGGCCHTFSKKGFEFDVGIHYIGDMDENSISRTIVDQLTDGQLQWAKMDSPYDVVILGDPENGKKYCMYSGQKEHVNGLKKEFPDETVAIDKFMMLVKKTTRGNSHITLVKMLPVPLVRFLHSAGLLSLISPFYRMASKSVSEVVSGLTRNADLKAVFSYIFPTYGVSPRESSFPLHAIIYDHYLRGAWYPQGGASEIPFHSIPIIERAGGAVLTKAPVQSILVDSQGKACGVSVKKGQDTMNIFAPVVISDAGIFNTYERLLPEKLRTLPGIQRQLSMVQHGVGGFSVFIGLRGSKEELGLEAKNHYVYRQNNLDEAFISYINSSRETAAKIVPFVYVSSPSAKDPLWEKKHPGKSTLIILTVARYEWFEEWKEEQVSKRAAEYEELKNTFVEAMMEVVYGIYPEVKDKVEYVSAGTPLSNKHYIAAPQGEFYGADQCLSRMQAEVIAAIRPRTAVPNLYLTGQDVLIGGFMGALHSALLCASAVLQRNVYINLFQLHRKIKVNNSKKKN